MDQFRRVQCEWVNRRERGFAMIEVILSVAVAVSLMVGAFWLLTEVRRKDMNLRTASELAIVQVQMRTRYLYESTIPPGDYTQVMADLTNFTNPNRAPERPLTAPTGSEIRVTSAGGTTFTIELLDVNQGACAPLVLIDESGVGSFGADVLEVASAASGYQHDVGLDGPIGPSEAAMLCDADSQDLLFTLAK